MNTKSSIPPAANDDIRAIASDVFLGVLREYDVVSAALFGSLVHGTATPDSDIDLLVTFGKPTSVFAQLELADALSQVTGRPVDIVTSLHPAFRPYIEPTLVALPL